MKKKCPECGSRHLISIRAYETITEYNNGRIVFQGSDPIDLYPMHGCADCGWGENSWGNPIDALGALKLLKERYGEGD